MDMDIDMTTPTDTSYSGKRLPARQLLVLALRDPKAPRVLTVGGLMEFARDHLGVELHEQTAKYNMATLTRDGLLNNPTRGLYLNTLAQPMPTVMELARHMRSGAVVSLQTVLGQRGVLNNPTPWVTCVVPRGRTVPVTGKVDVGGTTFSFSSMNQAAMCEHLPQLALQPYAPVPTATPEKALLDWIYLAKNSRKWSEPPRFDLDFELLDMDAMDTLAQAMGIAEEWVEFRDRQKPAAVPKKAPFQRPR